MLHIDVLYMGHCTPILPAVSPTPSEFPVHEVANLIYLPHYRYHGNTPRHYWELVAV